MENLTYAIEVALFNSDAKYLDDMNIKRTLIEFTPQSATGKLLLDINYDNVSVDFSAPRNFGEILGWSGQQVGPFPGQQTPIILIPQNVAKFNQIDYYLINSSIIEQGLRVNNRYNHTIARVLIDVEPGSQIIYSPNHPTRCNANNLRGVRKTEIEFWLTDQNYRRVNTQGENWSANIVIEYYLHINDPSFR